MGIDYWMYLSRRGAMKEDFIVYQSIKIGCNHSNLILSTEKKFKIGRVSVGLTQAFNKVTQHIITSIKWLSSWARKSEEEWLSQPKGIPL